MIGIGGAVGSANHVAPFGGMELLLGTNPLVAESTGADDSSGGGGTTGLPMLLTLLVFLRRRLYR